MKELASAYGSLLKAQSYPTNRNLNLAIEACELLFKSTNEKIEVPDNLIAVELRAIQRRAKNGERKMVQSLLNMRSTLIKTLKGKLRNGARITAADSKLVYEYAYKMRFSVDDTCGLLQLIIESNLGDKLDEAINLSDAALKRYYEASQNV